MRGLARLALLACAAACAGRGPTPEDAVRAYLDAVRNDDPGAAYALLSSEARRGLTREQFAVRWRDNRREAAADLAALRDSASHGAIEDARVIYGEGLAAKAVRDRAPAPPGWHLSDVPTARAPHSASPEEAVQAFLRAIDARDWEAISKLVAPATRESVERELRERAAQLRDTRRVEVSGDRARVRFGRFELSLERGGDGEWHVVGVK